MKQQPPQNSEANMIKGPIPFFASLRKEYRGDTMGLTSEEIEEFMNAFSSEGEDLPDLYHLYLQHRTDQFKKGILAGTQLFDSLAKSLLPHAAMRIGIDDNEFERRLTKVQVSLDPKVNCLIQPSPSWETFEITINSAFPAFLFVMFYLFATRVSGTGEDRHTEEESRIPLKRVARVAEKLMYAFWKCEKIYHPDLELISLSDIQLHFVHTITLYAVQFAIAHEIGHAIVALSHPRKVAEHEKGVERTKEFLASIRTLEGPVRDQLTQNWGSEIGADLIGLQLLLAADGNKIDERVYAYLAVDSTFILWHMLETFYQKKYKRSCVNLAHPPSVLRLDTLHSAIIDQQNIPEESRFFRELAQLTSIIISKV
jgi:hypothetical protein